MDSPTIERISRLHPSVRNEVSKIINECDAALTGRAKVRITQGLRTFEEQQKLYNQRPKVTNAKASGPNDIGAPLQGSLLKILVAEGDKIEKDTPLFIIEAMKMETTICAPKAGTIYKVVLKEKAMIEQDDCVIEIQ